MTDPTFIKSLSRLSPRRQLIGLTCLASFGVGSSVVALSFGVQDVDPLSLVTLRLLVAVLGFLLFSGLTGRRIPSSRITLRDIGVIGIIDACLTTVLFVSALQYISAAFMTLIATLIPLFTALMATYWMKLEVFNRVRFVGLFLALIGVGLLILSGAGGIEADAAVDPRGPLLALAASVAAAVAFVYARRNLSSTDPIIVAGGQMMVGFVVVGILTFTFSDQSIQRASPQALVAITYSGIVGSLLGIVTIYIMIQRFGATTASYPIYFAPFVAAILGVLLLNQPITAPILGGGLIVLLGVYLSNRKPALDEMQI